MEQNDLPSQKAENDRRQKLLLFRCLKWAAIVVVVHFFVTALFYILDLNAGLDAATRSNVNGENLTQLDSVLQLLVPLASEHSSLGGAFFRVVLSGIMYGVGFGFVMFIFLSIINDDSV